jgi:N-acyl-L-homoserine lactone synthetase
MPNERRDVSATGDAIAAKMLGSLEPLRFIEAVAAADRESCFRLRHRAVLEMRMGSTDGLSDGLETDEFDSDAIHILGIDDRRPVATLRVVQPALGRPLPTEAAFGLKLAGNGPVAEWGRVVVDPDYRGDGHSVFLGLAARSWLAVRERGYESVIGATPKRLITLFESLGFVVTVLGEARPYWGEERYPIWCDVRASIETLQREWLGR